MNGASAQLSAFSLNSKISASWIITVIVGCYIVYGGRMVIEGRDTLAAVLSTISLFRTLGAEFEKCFQQALVVTSSYPAICQITVFLNMPVDVPKKLLMGRSRRRQGKQLRAELRDEIAKGKAEPNSIEEVAVDRLPLVVERVAFSYGGLEEGTVEDLNARLEQGRVIAVVGDPSQGKATIMRLIAGQVFPTNLPKLGEDLKKADDSRLFVPPHLRVVQVQENPMILGPEETIFENLVYGFKVGPSLDMKALEERCIKVMRRLGLSGSLLDQHFKERGFLGVGGCCITRADRQLISIGRALIMNPEMIVLHKPTALLDDSHTIVRTRSR
mmetsp:Transcript_66321/g.149752  ORF Transcript_66321/g.149752 Transcript_66321/m.149752 type:complete len:329 (-) Transcript_66321:17-1003(-)